MICVNIHFTIVRIKILYCDSSWEVCIKSYRNLKALFGNHPPVETIGGSRDGVC